jgi:predicted nucleotidyltransferase
VTGLIEAKKSELADLCERHRVERLALFGSALREDFDSGRSDLDFVVEFLPMSPQEHAGAYFGLLDDLESLFGRRVDLVELGAVRNPYLRREIEEQQETLVGCCDCGRPEGVGV